MTFLIENRLEVTDPIFSYSVVWDGSSALVSVQIDGERFSHSRPLGRVSLSGVKTALDGLTADMEGLWDGLSASIADPVLSNYKISTLSPYAVEIDAVYHWAFPDDKFVLSGFEIPLDTLNGAKVVNLAYFQWQEFRNELDSGKYEALKRALMPLWDSVAAKVAANDIIVL